MTAFMGDSVASPLVWAITIVVTVGLLVLDVVVIGRRPHEPSTARCRGTWRSTSGSRSSSASALWFFAGRTRYAAPRPEFFAGWLTEYSLSIDNLFIFIIIMAKLRGAAAATSRPR